MLRAASLLIAIGFLKSLTPILPIAIAVWLVAVLIIGAPHFLAHAMVRASPSKSRSSRLGWA